MQEFPPYDSERRMGRPPLKLKDPTVKTTIRLPTSLLTRLNDVAGDGGSAAFIREAIEEKLAATEPPSRNPTTPQLPRRAPKGEGE